MTGKELALVLNSTTKSLFTRNDGSPALFSREVLMDRLRGKEGTKKDLDLECDYPNRSTFEATFYRTQYDYIGPATRSVNVYPAETWKALPALYETNKKRNTPFERKWFEYTEDPDLNVIGALRLVDELSLIGRYGGLLIGMSGQDNLKKPAADVVDGKIVRPTESRDLIFLRAFDESSCKIKTWDTKQGQKHFGWPETYEISLLSEKDLSATQPGVGTKTEVHWTRIFHVAWLTKENPVFSTPILQNLIPYIWDTRKVGGGSAEMFWQGAFPGISFETMPEMIQEGGNVELDEESVKEQVNKYMRRMQRYIALTGVHANSLAPQVADPTPHMKVAYELICLTLGVPVPIWLGQQEGHLAGITNKSMWNDKISERRNTYATPRLCKGFIKRLADLNLCPRPSQIIAEWLDPNTQSDADKADVALKRMQGLTQYAGGNARFMLDSYKVLTKEFGYSDEEAKEITSKKIADFVPKEITNPPVKTAGGNRTGASSKGKSAGRKRGTVSKS